MENLCPLALNGRQCRLIFDPKELQQLLDEQVAMMLKKKAKVLDSMTEDLSGSGSVTEIDEDNFALHLMTLGCLAKKQFSSSNRPVDVA